jgi:hypothetical protein
MRAALGLPPLAASTLDSNETALYLQAHAQAAQAQRQQSEQLQRDFHLRQAILQDQIDRHFNVERLRGLPGGFLDENPDMQTLRAELELRELEGQRQLEERRLTEQEFLRHLCYQDEVRRQQQQLGGFQAHEDVLAQQRAQAQALAQAQAQAQVQAAQVRNEAQERVKAQQAVQERFKAHLAAQTVQEQAAYSGATGSTAGANGTAAKAKGKAAKTIVKPGKGKAHKLPKGHAAATGENSLTLEADASAVDPKSHKAKGKSERKRKDAPSGQRVIPTSLPEQVLRPSKRAKAVAGFAKGGLATKLPPPGQPPSYVPKKGHLNQKPHYPRVSAPESALDAVAIAAELQTSWIDVEIPRKGTFEGLLAAAEEEETLDGAAGYLCLFKNDKSESLDLPCIGPDESDDGLGLPVLPAAPAETIAVGRFNSELPALPQEPEIDLSSLTYQYPKDEERETHGQQIDAYVSPLAKTPEKRNSADMKSRMLGYPINVDSWWPTVEKVKAERRALGEISDEDDFEESLHFSGGNRLFRANEKKIRHRLATMVEPGCLEKLNHCRIHRVRTKDKKMSNSTPELVFCFQVTELYPNDIMVNCSKCGTWRHAACGGHWKPYSTRDNCNEPFIAVCENCHDEDPFLRDYPRGKQRLERQRMDHLRRSLATTAVMRFASYSKHAGTYKWPLGSVSATHIGGHTRSVQARHEKAERQWAEMINRTVAAENGGGKAKANSRIRTKDLEHVIVAIDDAESNTDRHNMMNFLLRDTSRDVPIGYANQPRNYFDPETEFNTPVAMQTATAHTEDAVISEAEREAFDGVAGVNGSASGVAEPDNLDGNETSDESSRRLQSCCARSGCSKAPRFDSQFCSDGCGVSALESDLLLSFQDAGELHPSVLRLN